MATSGQTLNDRINAARYALAGQGLARCVCKATTEEVIGPKKKHLDYLLACTHEPNVSIPQLANLLIERTNHIYWVVVFKALVTVHHLMSYGNERFTQYLASSNYSFELSTFLDKTAARDFSMSTFIRRYSRYINEKALSYRLLAFDFCKVKRGNEGVLRLMPIDRLLKTLPILQNQLDALLEFDCSANDLNNGVINACFMLLFRDLIGLFACHNDGIINLLNKYFTLNRKMCREAFDLYKKFLVRMDKVSEFLRVAEVVGIDKDEIPDLRRAPSSLIDALEQHLQNIESNKKILKQQQTSSSSTTSNGKTGSGLQVLANLTPPSSRRSSSPQGTAMAAQGSMGDDFALSTSFKDDEVRKALEEEARVLSQYGSIEASGVKSKCKSSSISNGGANSPKFATAAAATIPKSIDDIFGDADSFATTTTTSKNNNKSGGNLLSEQVGGGAPAFDNLSTSSSSTTTTTNTAKQRPDVDSIKSAILSATSTLEKSSAINSSSDSSRPTVKKASDELFSLLDSGSTTTSNSTTSALASPNPLDGSNSTNNKPLSPFATPSATNAFDMLTATSTITTNGHLPGPPTLKPGNPFPEVAGDLSSAFRAAPFASGALPTPQVVAQPTIGNSAVFKSGVSTANYTNLGGLEGFGDLLQPMSTTSKTNTSNSTNNGGTSKPSFNSASGLSSTGLFKGDLDSTLANLAQNLTFDAINKTKK